ncbi:hypothetical protein BH20ACI4_BH20ACI4_34170 [soil metagenome]
MKKVIFFSTLIFIFSLKVICQNPLPTPPPIVDETDVIKISTTLIQVDVTVTDKKGNIVTDLKPGDFEVYENGKKQDITNFSFIFQGNKNQQTEAAEQPKPVKGKDAIPIPPVKLKAEDVRRTYALVVDDLGLNFGSVNWVRQALKKFVNEQMQEGDLVAIIRTGGGLGALQSFTADKRQLLAAIDKIKWNSQGRSGISTFAPIQKDIKEEIASTSKSGRTVEGSDDDKDFQNQIDEFRNENFSVGTLGALGYVIRGMQEMPGRKSVMLFSEGFSLTSDNAPNRVLDAMRVLADIANRASFVIYTLDPRGLQVPGMGNAEDDISDIFAVAPQLANRETNFQDSQQSLRYLAYETGGIPFVNQNNLNKGIERAVNDQSGYYLLGYEPDETTFDPKKAKFNKLEVKVLRPELKIRYRSGFFGVTDEKIQNIAKTPQQKMVGALTSPFGAADINLNLYPVFRNDPKDGNIIHTLVYIDTKDLKFSEENGGIRKANFDLLAMTFGDNGVAINRLSKNYTIEVPEKTYQNILKNGFIYTISMPIKKSGAYQFRIALRDTTSDKIGAVSQFIEVPNIKKRLVLSNIILDDFTPEEWQKIRLGGSRDESERSVLLDTILRQFRRGTILRYDYVVYNPKQSRGLQTQLRLIRDGKVIYEEPLSPLKTDGQNDILRIQTAGAITLGTNLEAGNYILQIIAADGANEKRFATQFVEFEIVE